MFWKIGSLLLVNILITGYVIFICHHYGTPENLSATYYLWKDRKSFEKYLFRCLMWLIVIAFGVMAFLASVPEHLNVYPLVLASCFLLSLVGFLEDYKQLRIRFLLHYGFAIAGVVCAVVWMIIVDWTNIYLTIPIVLGVSLMEFAISGTKGKNVLLWLELAGIYAGSIVILRLNGVLQ